MLYQTIYPTLLRYTILFIGIPSTLNDYTYITSYTNLHLTISQTEMIITQAQLSQLSVCFSFILIPFLNTATTLALTDSCCSV